MQLVQDGCPLAMTSTAR